MSSEEFNAAGMLLSFLARLSGRQCRHVRLSSGPGGGSNSSSNSTTTLVAGAARIDDQLPQQQHQQRQQMSSSQEEEGQGEDEGGDGGDDDDDDDTKRPQDRCNSHRGVRLMSGPTLRNPLLALEDEDLRVESAQLDNRLSAPSFPCLSSMDRYPERYDDERQVSSGRVRLLSVGLSQHHQRPAPGRRRARAGTLGDDEFEPLRQRRPTEKVVQATATTEVAAAAAAQGISNTSRFVSRTQQINSNSNRTNISRAQNCWCSSSSRGSGKESMRFPPYLATLLILSYGFIGMADACSSRSTPKPRPPTPTPRPNITFHMYTCPPDYAEFYCLNGATCFTVKIVDSLLYNCLCANGYIGQRCEFKDLDGSYLPSRQRVMLETAGIAGAVTIAVFLAVITFISVYIHCKRKQKELRLSAAQDAVDSPCRIPELRPFCTRGMRSHMIFMAKPPNRNSLLAISIEQTRMPYPYGWSQYMIETPESPAMRVSPAADASMTRNSSSDWPSTNYTHNP